MERQNSPSDVAALSASAVAVSVSLFVLPGPYTLMNFVVSVTLIIILFGSLGENHRTVPKSAAIAAAIALSSLPGAGLVFEALRTGSPWHYVIGKVSGPQTSQVKETDLALWWLAVLIAAIAADRIFQSRDKHRLDDNPQPVRKEPS
jgi:hypothetical protein